MMAPDPRAEERVGSVLHEKWTLERLIGVGGMGAVYAARHRNGARAAVKILSPSMGRIPHVRKRFLHEGYAANRVEHAGAVKVLDDDVIQDGPDEGTAYLVMELLDGESLGDRARRDPPLTEWDLLTIADGVLAVLDAAHTNGVVHRDLKPDNLFLARDPEREGVTVKVLDFGLARLLEAQELTVAGMALGTPTYMSPEQASGHVALIDGRTDIYALGSILFQLATNKRIHEAAHTLGLVVRMATTPAPKIRTLSPEVTEPFARIVDHALEFKREERYADARTMRADVVAALALVPSDGSTLDAAVVSGPAPPAAPLPPPPPLAPAPAAPEVAFVDAPGRVGEQTSPAHAPTVRVAAVAAAAAAPSLGGPPRRAHEEEREEDARSSSDSVSGERSTARGGGSVFRTAFLLLVTFGASLFLWHERASIASLLGGTAASPDPGRASVDLDAATSGAAASGRSTSEPSDAASDVSPVAATLDDADATDAAIDAPDDDEDEDDDDDPDASDAADASASSAPTAVRPGPRVNKPVPKKHPPRRPGHPRRKKRKRF